MIDRLGKIEKWSAMDVLYHRHTQGGGDEGADGKACVRVNACTSGTHLHRAFPDHLSDACVDILAARGVGLQLHRHGIAVPRFPPRRVCRLDR